MHNVDFFGLFEENKDMAYRIHGGKIQVKETYPTDYISTPTQMFYH